MTLNQADDLRQRILSELERVRANDDLPLPLSDHGNKDLYRALHAPAVRLALEQNQSWIQWAYPRYSIYFASGSDVNPEKVQPLLVEVTKAWQYDLFRLARLTWSLPFTKGYGRRLRFLIMDTSNQKLIGILGFQSPPLDFPARDRLFTYPIGRKVEMVNQTMDIYTLGAVPPYSRLLGGKLVALAAASDEVRRAYRRKYSARLTELEKRRLPPHFVALTTTSAFGKSSLYNRLTYLGRRIAHSIGYTEGYGGFHLATLYPAVREFLEKQGISTRGGFGVGPRIVWQTYIRASERLGISRDLLKHGIRREVFLFPLVSNLTEYMEGHTRRPLYYHQSFADIARWWRERWLLPRAQRVDGWHTWDKREIEHILVVRANVWADNHPPLPLVARANHDNRV